MNREFIQALHALEKEKGIEASVILEALEAALISAYKKNYDSLMNVDVHIDAETGDIQVLSTKEVVDEVNSTQTEISLDDARLIKEDAEIGDLVHVEEQPRNFGRIAAQTAKQVVVQRIREAERGRVYNEFSGKESEIISGAIERIDGGVCYIKLNKTDAILPVSEQIPGEDYYVGKRIKACIVDVRRSSVRGNERGPQVIISRKSPTLLTRLFEMEVPEIKDGYVTIKSVAREAGMRSKIAVASSDDDIDAVGSCVGPNGGRVRVIVDELCGEKIDIINWDESPDIYIAEALSPSLVIDVLINEEEKIASVIVPDNQLSLAIGKEGQNVRLAARLTGWKIDIKSREQADEQGITYNYIFCDKEDCESDLDA
jgi:N utilization substance protein A